MFDYLDYCERDLVTPLIPAFQAKDCFLREDKICIPLSDGISSPWIHAAIRTDTNCNRYQMVYHRAYGFIPKKCHGCWKVVQRPRNLCDLFEILAYQKEMRIPSKCGIETRQYVFGNYGAYWYNKTQEEGLERLDVVKKDFPDIPAILKRGCTEFEASHGPSDQWVLRNKIVEFEEKLDEIIVEIWKHDMSMIRKVSEKVHPWFIEEHIKRRWVEFAYDRGDPTYKLYTRGQPLTTPVIEYERELENGCEVTGLIKLAR